MIADEKLARAASRACRIANVPADPAQAGDWLEVAGEGGDTRSATPHELERWIEDAPVRIASQPEEVQRAASALLHATIAHCLMNAPNKQPRALRWAGRRWYLTSWPQGRVHVSPIQGNGHGLVSSCGELAL